MKIGVLWLFLAVTVSSLEYILPQSKLKCFHIEPEGTSSGNFFTVSYKIPLSNKNVRVEVRDAKNYTINKQSNQINIQMGESHQLCFENTGDIEQTIEFEVKSDYLPAERHEVDRIVKVLENATNTTQRLNETLTEMCSVDENTKEVIEQTVEKVKIAGWVKALIVLVIIAMNASVLKCWRRRKNQQQQA